MENGNSQKLTDMQDDVLIRKNNFTNCALSDIYSYLVEENKNIRDENNDIWVVTPKMLNTKENKKLNRELGLHKINKFGKRMVRKYKLLKHV